MRTILICSLIFAMAIFPISIEFDGILSDKKGYFCLSIYSVVLIGGYVKLNQEKLVVHLSKRRAVEIEPLELLKRGGSLNKFKGLTPYSFKSCLISGIGNNFGLKSCFILTSLRDIVAPIFTEKYPWIKIKSDILILENDEVRYVIQLKWWANLFWFISFVIKEIIEGVKNGKRKQGQY